MTIWGPLQASRYGPADGGDTAKVVREADGVAAPGQWNAHAHLQHQEGVLRPKIEASVPLGQEPRGRR